MAYFDKTDAESIENTKNTIYNGNKQLYSDKLSQIEIDRMACLLNDISGTTTIISSILKDGYDRIFPCGSVFITNREKLENKLAHMINSIQDMVLAKDISREGVDKFMVNNDEKFIEGNNG